MTDLSKNLLFLRKSRDLKQQELADLLHIKRNTLSDYENGNSEPNISTLRSFAELFDITIDDLVGSHASLIAKLEGVESDEKSKPKSNPKGKPNEEKIDVLKEPKAHYGASKNQDSKDVIIENQRNVIDTQKALIEQLNLNISMLKEKIEGAKKEQN